MTEKPYPELLEALIKTLRGSGALKTEAVEAAFRKVPRHLFLPNLPLEQVYADEAIMVKSNEEGRWTSSSSQPSMMAIMLEQLELRPGLRVLEIGAGTGYNAALMAELVGPAGSVTTIDIQPDLIEAARAALDAAGYSRVQAVVGDGGFGYAEGAPFDRIILTVGAYSIAPAWREQLVEGGLLVLPLEIIMAQKSTAFERRGQQLVSRSLSDCGFMPLQGAFAAPPKVQTPLAGDPRLFIETSRALAEDAARLAAWLEGPRRLLPSGMVERLGTIHGSLLLWIALHLGLRAHWVELTARKELADQDLVPPFIAIGGDLLAMTTLALLEPHGAAALSRPPEEPIVWITPASMAAGDESPLQKPFELFVRQLGPDDGPALRLVELIRQWDAAGRPGSANLRLRALPAEVELARLPEGEFLLEKPWTKLVVRYDHIADR